MSRTATILILNFSVISFFQNSMAIGEITWKGMGKGGAVAAGKPESVAAGIEILKEGGNAADAAAATILALAVSDYGSFSMGGEVPVIVFDQKTSSIKTLCGQGAAPLDPKAIEWYYANGIPAKGDMKAAPVPGAIDLVVTLLRMYGTISFERAVKPTLALLDREKEPVNKEPVNKASSEKKSADKDSWHKPLAVTLRKLVAAEQMHAGSREAKLMAARDRFYMGDVADQLEAWFIETGSFLRKSDLAAHKTLVEEPVSIQYRGYTVYKCGPWTQGPYLCQTLRLLEGFDVKQMGHLSPQYVHVVTEALKLGFADRDEYYADPRFTKVPLVELFSDEYTKIRRALIDTNTASLVRRPGNPWKMTALKEVAKLDDSTSGIPVQDTTTCVVADRWGNVVAATPSCNMLTNRPGPTGVNHGNRVRCLNTTPGHPNRIEPGKRPRITLTPTLVTKNGRPIIAVSVAGGDLQDQTTLNILLNHIDFGMLPERAVTTPRFNTSHHQDSFDPNSDRSAAFLGAGTLRVNEEIDEAARNDLTQRGHKVSTIKGAIGNPVMIFIDPSAGTFYAAGDPKAGRHAAAVD